MAPQFSIILNLTFNLTFNFLFYFFKFLFVYAHVYQNLKIDDFTVFFLSFTFFIKIFSRWIVRKTNLLLILNCYFKVTLLSVFVPKNMCVFLESWFVKKIDFAGITFHQKGKKWEHPTKEKNIKKLLVFIKQCVRRV